MSTLFKFRQSQDNGKKDAAPGGSVRTKSPAKPAAAPAAAAAAPQTKEYAKKATTMTKKTTTAMMQAYDTSKEYAALERLIKEAPWKKTSSSPEDACGGYDLEVDRRGKTFAVDGCHGMQEPLLAAPASSNQVQYKEGQKVKIEILRKIEIRRFEPWGARAKILDDGDEPEGLISGEEIESFEDANQKRVKPGDKLFAWITDLRDGDAKVDLTLKEPKFPKLNQWIKAKTFWRKKHWRKLLASGQEGHTALVSSATFSPDGALLASSSYDKTVIIWTITGEIKHQLQGHADLVSVTFSPDGTLLASLLASASKNDTVIIWTITGEMKHQLKGHTAKVFSVTFSPDGTLLASASDDKTVIIWTITGEMERQLFRHTNSVFSVTFSPDGTLLASASRDSTVIMWTSNGELVHQLRGHTNSVFSVTFSPDGTLLASASVDNTVIMWTITGEMVHQLQGHTGRVNSVIFSPDGARLASASEDNTVIMWTITGEMKHQLKGHTGFVNSVTFSPDGTRLASASSDNTVIIWTSNGEKEHVFEDHTERVFSARFSPDGLSLVTASEDEQCIIFDMEVLAVKKKLAKLDFPDRASPWLSAGCLVTQITGFATSKSYPWNVNAVKPFQMITYLTMLNLDKIDFAGSHVFFCCFKLILAAFVATDFSWCAFRGELLISSRFLDSAKVEKLRKYIVLGMTLVGFVPVLTVFAESIACWSWHRPEGFYLPMACPMEDDGYDGSPVPYWCMCFFLSVVGFFFIWAQVPYIFSGGDVTLIRPEDMFSPGRWIRALETKQHRLNMGLFRKETGLALYAATISDMIMKIMIPIASKMVPLDARRPYKIAGALICLMAIMQRCVVQAMWPMYKIKTANIFESGCKAILFAVQFAGVILLLTFGDDRAARPWWPVLLLYLSLIVLVGCVGFRMDKQAKLDFQ